MLRPALAVFLVLHGLVHVWYVVLSRGWVEAEDAMGWNGHSWLLSGVLPEDTVLSVASVLYVLVTLGFVAGGVGVALRQSWGPTVVVGAAVLSALVLVALWDGKPALLVEKGFVGVVIDVALVALLVVR